MLSFFKASTAPSKPTEQRSGHHNPSGFAQKMNPEIFDRASGNLATKTEKHGRGTVRIEPCQGRQHEFILIVRVDRDENVKSTAEQNAQTSH